MDSVVDRVWTQAAFFDWAEAQGERYEFDGNGPVLMTRGTNNHSQLHANIMFALGLRLRGGSCRVLGPEAGVETVEGGVRYPDALVTCLPIQGRARTVQGVVAVFEVISPSSVRVDRIDKVREYAAVPSIMTYVIVESTAVGITVLSREQPGSPWIATALAEGDALALAGLGDVPVNDIYDGVDFT